MVLWVIFLRENLTGNVLLGKTGDRDPALSLERLRALPLTSHMTLNKLLNLIPSCFVFTNRGNNTHALGLV